MANFSSAHHLVATEHNDVWIGDEAWELDYYPQPLSQRTGSVLSVWSTDFVGWLPMSDGGAREEFLAPPAHYTAEMDRAHRQLPARPAHPDDIRPNR